MVKEVLKGVGKKLILQDDCFEVKKTLGKNINIPIRSIKGISYEKGTVKKNGMLNIEWVDQNNSDKTEMILFYYSSNEVVRVLVEDVNVYTSSSEPKRDLVLNQSDKISLFSQLTLEAKEESKKTIEEKLRLKTLDEQKIPHCPKCHSTSLHAEKRGWKATTGLLGSSKIVITCLNCGNKFKPGKNK